MNDPFLGTPDEQAAYLAKIDSQVQAEVEKDRAGRLAESAVSKDQAPAIVGAIGGAGAITAAIR
jgi:hypothetical protein